MNDISDEHHEGDEIDSVLVLDTVAEYDPSPRFGNVISVNHNG